MIRGIEKTSFIDYEGLISTVVFLGTCNMNCFYCHNREILTPREPIMSISSFIDFLKTRIGLIDAVVISGGEPTIHYNLIDFIKLIRTLPFKIKLDTNGSHPHVVRKILKEGLVDYIALDMKAPYERYAEVTSSSIKGELIHQTLEYIISSHIPYCVRTTMVPTITLDDLKKIAIQMPPVNKWKLQWYKEPILYLEKDEERIRGNYITLDVKDTILETLIDIQKNTTF
jgi:pyruvate formate lyase activating enzyme